MKRLIYVLILIICGLTNTNAQNYDNYLQNAYTQLANGNIENASKAYSVYCTMTDSRDLAFEEKLEEARNANNWKSECYIIALNDTINMAIQKWSPSQVAVSHDAAKKIAESSMLGGFTDWHLPNSNEIDIIFANLPKEDIKFSSFWGDALSKINFKRTKTYSDSHTGKTLGESYHMHTTDYFYKDQEIVKLDFYEDYGYGYNTTKKTYKINDGPTIIYSEISPIDKHNFFIIRNFYANDENKTYGASYVEANVKVRTTRTVSYSH